MKAYKIFIVILSFVTCEGAYSWTVKDTISDISTELYTPKTIVKKNPSLEKKSITPILEPDLKLKQNKTSFEKSAASYNIDEQISVDYYAALEYIKKGNLKQAEKKLVNNINSLPNHSPSRAELATLYIKHHRDLEAEQLLAEGLIQDEENPEFLKLMAILLERRNDPESALGLLSKLPEGRKNEKNVVVLLGQLYQQTGRYELAKQQYGRLLQIEPNNPIWMLGRAIALESEGKSADALEDYQKIRKADGINPQILDYVDNRITALKG